MDVYKVRAIAIKVVVTFVEAAVAFLAVNRWDFSNKAVIAGAVGAGISAVYNVTKHYIQVNK